MRYLPGFAYDLLGFGMVALSSSAKYHVRMYAHFGIFANWVLSSSLKTCPSKHCTVSAFFSKGLLTGRGTINIDLVEVATSVQPNAGDATRFTVKFPPLLYVCVIFTPVSWVPSPKIQVYLIHPKVAVLVFVKVILFDFSQLSWVPLKLKPITRLFVLKLTVADFDVR